MTMEFSWSIRCVWGGQEITSAHIGVEILQYLQYHSLRQDRSYDESAIQSGSRASRAYADASRPALRFIATLSVSAGEKPTPSNPGIGAVSYQGLRPSPDRPTCARDPIR